MERSGRHLIVLSCCASLALLSLSTDSARARVTFVDTKVKIRTTGEGLSGSIVARPDRRFCEGRRRVKVFRKEPGGDVLIGKSRTDNLGRWAQTLHAGEFGDFYASASRKLRIISGNGVDCAAGQSRVVTIVPPEGS